MLQPILPFLVLLIVAIIFGYIPMNSTLRSVGYLIVGIAAIVLLLQFLHLL